MPLSFFVPLSLFSEQIFSSYAVLRCVARERKISSIHFDIDLTRYRHGIDKEKPSPAELCCRNEKQRDFGSGEQKRRSQNRLKNHQKKGDQSHQMIIAHFVKK